MYLFVPYYGTHVSQSISTTHNTSQQALLILYDLAGIDGHVRGDASKQQTSMYMHQMHFFACLLRAPPASQILAPYHHKNRNEVVSTRKCASAFCLSPVNNDVLLSRSSHTDKYSVSVLRVAADLPYSPVFLGPRRGRSG